MNWIARLFKMSKANSAVNQPQPSRNQSSADGLTMIERVENRTSKTPPKGYVIRVADGDDRNGCGYLNANPNPMLERLVSDPLDATLFTTQEKAREYVGIRQPVLSILPSTPSTFLNPTSTAIPLEQAIEDFTHSR